MSGSPEDAARADFVRISSDPHSTERSIVLLRHLADAFASRSIDLAADRLEGTASKTGPAGEDDSVALRSVADLSAKGFEREAVSIVARAMAPHDPRAQATIARRLRNKRAALK